LSAKGNILIGITGGIAAYKTLSLIRLFVKSGYEVKVAATKNALQFVTPLTIETLSNHPLYANTFNLPSERNVEHISLSDWADIVVVAPASANIIGKLASGIADDALSTLLLAVNKPVFIAPSMNEKMFSNFAVQRNLNYLQSNGINIINPEIGFLACHTEGNGRMPEPESIFYIVTDFLKQKKEGIKFKALVTAGPTYEPIDPVRFIGNYSSGLMGFSLAEALANKGIYVELVSGPTTLELHHPLVHRTDVKTASEMLDACEPIAKYADILIMAAAVADYTPTETKLHKIKKEDKTEHIELKPTVDILKTIAIKKKKNQLVIGFALETDNELENAIKKLHAKNADYIVLNSLNEEGAGFGVSTNKVSLIDASEKIINIPLQSKKKVAESIIEHVLQIYTSKKNKKT